MGDVYTRVRVQWKLCVGIAVLLKLIFVAVCDLQLPSRCPQLLQVLIVLAKVGCGVLRILGVSPACLLSLVICARQV